MLTIRMFLVLHPGQKNYRWTNNAVILMNNALRIISELTDRTADLVLPSTLRVEYDSKSTLLREHALLRRYNKPNEINVFWTVGAGHSSDLPESSGRGPAAGWGSGDGSIGHCTMHSEMLDEPNDPINIYILVHELFHTLGLPHPNNDPLAIPCKYYRIMCYSGWNFTIWYKYRDEEEVPIVYRKVVDDYGLSLDEVEYIQSLSTLREVKMPEYVITKTGSSLYPTMHDQCTGLRTNGDDDIDQIQLHATRGAVALDLQVSATVNWFASEQNQQNAVGQNRGWGGSADFVVGHDSRVAGSPIVIVELNPDWLLRWSRYSAGYGSSWRTQYAAAKRGVAIEIAQRTDDDVFEPEVIDAVVWLVKHINDTLINEGKVAIPYSHLLSWTQERNEPVPRGIIGHDELANGVKLGKSDPGKMFPWTGFLTALKGEVEPAPTEPEIPPVDVPDHSSVLAALDSASDSIDVARRLIEGNSE